jgi:hypothetical protein
MSTELIDIIQNSKDLYMSDSAVQSLIDFERVLDELDLYVFKHWKKGELIVGPEYEKYFVRCTFMWPRKMMPDPRGGERLLDYGCEVYYKRDMLKYPMKVKDPNDFEPGTKMPKLATAPVWIVEIVMPKKLMQDVTRGSVELENESVDAEDIEQAYETGADEDAYKTPDAQMEQPPTGPAPAPTGVPA